MNVSADTTETPVIDVIELANAVATATTPAIAFEHLDDFFAEDHPDVEGLNAAVRGLDNLSFNRFLTIMISYNQEIRDDERQQGTTLDRRVDADRETIRELVARSRDVNAVLGATRLGQQDRRGTAQPTTKDRPTAPKEPTASTAAPKVKEPRPAPRPRPDKSAALKAATLGTMRSTLAAWVTKGDTEAARALAAMIADAERDIWPIDPHTVCTVTLGELKARHVACLHAERDQVRVAAAPSPEQAEANEATLSRNVSIGVVHAVLRHQALVAEGDPEANEKLWAYVQQLTVPNGNHYRRVVEIVESQFATRPGPF